MTEVKAEKSYEFLFPTEYGFYFYNNPEDPLVLDDQAKVVSFMAQGVKFSVTDYGQFIAYDTQRTIWGEAAYYAQDCQYIPVNLQPCKLLMIMASEFGKTLSYYDLYAKFFDISGYLPDAEDDRLRRAAYHEGMFDHSESETADETVTHGWHRADEFQQKIAKLLYRLNQVIPPQLQIKEKRGVGYGLYPR